MRGIKGGMIDQERSDFPPSCTSQYIISDFFGSCSQGIVTVDKSRLRDKLGELSGGDMQHVENAMRVRLGL